MRFPSRLILLLILIFPAVAPATDVEGLYSATVSVADRSDTEFKRGVAAALAVVITKLTGSATQAQSGAGRAVVGQAQRMVQQFGYEIAGNGSLLLRVEFDARVLTAEMRSHDLVVWGKERPDTLAWLIVEDTNGRRLLGAQDEHPLLGALKARAAARGIPVVLPLGDISEASAIGTAPTASAMADALRESSAKYGVSSVLVGYVQQAGPSLWDSSWYLSVEQESLVWDEQSDLVEQLGEEAGDVLADALGRRYASPAIQSGADTVAVTVHDLLTPEDYARTERYLRTLDSVTKVLVRRVDKTGIVFDLNVQGGAVALRQGISFGHTLSPDPDDPTSYRLNPR